ncbi:MAG: outer membrane protein assembly factor BamE [Gammaproteobacteria bacterium]|nr:outer membrane protein assembly factor BamE [Gammaproteobacteria bacterium]MBU1444273.1 outer membrane protein assembly factor BamE [Gammaproteobacteria bacterium]MBU2286221.1 outer membrane protein assembly factor BamE [Gammaproteobacteria bacterium]MBU2409458.1 outer membrane protein assembly factor BamE [Gammaproteobacteria bacterium]
MNVHRPSLGLVAAALLSLTGCGTSTVSKNVSDDGRSAEVVFPDIRNHAWQREGTFPNIDSLRRIAPGATKDQLYDLLGRPHFRESLVGVREWDYILNFRTDSGVTTCQYKVLFDTKMVAQSFHWAPAACADRVQKPVPIAQQAEPTPKEPLGARESSQASTPASTAPRRVEISADALFEFGRSGLTDLQAGGLRELDKLAESLRATFAGARLQVVGHTDRLGSDATNDRLSLGRATTVRDYLVQSGVPPQNVGVLGRGKAEPKVYCDQVNRQALIACLAPNRRVEIVAR